MHVIDLQFPHEILEDMFHYEGEGQNGKATALAHSMARIHLGVDDDAEMRWHLPDVFAVRYGSSYVASASCGRAKVRFHSIEGDFREGDDL